MLGRSIFTTMGVLRLVLTLSIVFGHLRIVGTIPADVLPYLSGGHYAGALRIHGFFLIAGFFYDLVLQTKFTGGRIARRFWVSRLLRLLPNYYLILLACLWFYFACAAFGMETVNPISPTYYQIRGNLYDHGFAYVLQNVLVIVPSLFSFRLLYHNPEVSYLVVSQAWSFTIEYCFMLIAPFVLLRRWLYVPCFVVLALLTWLYCSFGIYRNHVGTELLYFMIGSACYRLSLRLPGSVPLACWRVLGGLLFCIVVAMLVYFDLMAAVYGGVVAYWGSLAVLAVSVPVLFVATRGMALDRMLGNLTYPVYLNHFLVLALLGHFGCRPEWLWWFTPICCVLLAIPMAYLVDWPIQQWRIRHYRDVKTDT